MSREDHNRFTGLDDRAIGNRSGVVVSQDCEELVAVAGEIAQHRQRVSQAVNRDAVLWLHLPDEFEQVILGILQRKILDPVWRIFIRRFWRGTIERIQVVEENDGDAARRSFAVLRQVGKSVWRERLLRWLFRANGGVGGKNADLLRFSAVENGEVVFCEIRDGATFVADNHADFNEASRHEDSRSLW